MTSARILEIPDTVNNGLLIIQGTGFCNLNCRYCYVPDRQNKSKMSLELLDRAIKKIFLSKVYNKKLDVVWHAGEPLVLGVPYYEEALKIIKSSCPEHLKLRFAIQTNATLINQKWVDFFKKHKFHIGVSIDGPQFLHDAERVGWNGKGSFNETYKGLKTIQENGISHNVICVLTANSLNYPDELYQFFKENGVKNLCFNIEEQDGEHIISTLSSENRDDIEKKFSFFMSRLFDLWDADGRSMIIREIDKVHNNIKGLMFCDNPIYDAQELTPFKILTLTQNGDIILFSPELAGGTRSNSREFVVANIDEIDSLEDIAGLESFQKIFEQIDNGVRKCRDNCAYYGLCPGGSPSNKYTENGTFDSSETLCCRLRQQITADIILEKAENASRLMMSQ